MANFKVGQRVRIVNDIVFGFRAVPPNYYLGKEAVIIAPGGYKQSDWRLLVAGETPYLADVFARNEELVPLTDPKADEFVERIKKLKPYEEPCVDQDEWAKKTPREKTPEEIANLAEFARELREFMNR